MPIRPEYYLLGGGGGGAAGELAFQLGEEDPPVFVQVFSADTMEEAREERDEHARDPANTPWLDQYRVDEKTRQINKVLVLEDTTEGRFLLCAWDEQTPEYSAALASGNAVRTLLNGIGLTGGDDPDLGLYFYRFTNASSPTGGRTKAQIDSIKAAFDGFFGRDAGHNPPFLQFGASGSETRQRIHSVTTYPHRTAKSIWGATFDGYTIGAKPQPHSRFNVAANTVSIPDGGGGVDVARIRNTVAAFNAVEDSRPWTFRFNDTNGLRKDYNIVSMEAFIFPGEFWTYKIVLNTEGVDIPSQTPTTWDILAHQPEPNGWRFQLDMGPTGVLPARVLAAGDWSVVDRDLTHSWIESGGADGGEGFRKGPEQNLFSAADLATAKAARDTYALDADNADWLREYKNNRLLYFLLLEDETAKQITVEAYDKEVDLYTSQFGTGTPPNQLAAKPSGGLEGLSGSRGGSGRRYRLEMDADTYADVEGWKNAANAAFDRGDPWHIEDSSGSENAYIPFAAHVTTSTDRSRQSIWSETWDDDGGVRRQVGALPTAVSGVDYLVRRGLTEQGVVRNYLSLTVGTGTAAQTQATAIVSAFSDAKSRPWRATYTDALNDRKTNVAINLVSRDTFDVVTTPDPSNPGRTVTTTYQRVNFRLPAAGGGASGAATGLTLTARIPDHWLLNVPIGDYDGTTPSDLAAGEWDFMDRNIRHDWISIGAGGAVAGLNQTEVDARVRALVNRVALAGNTAKWDESKVPDPDVAFVDLTDGPGDIEAGKYVAGNAAGDALEFVDAPAGGGGGGAADGGVERYTDDGSWSPNAAETRALNGKTILWDGTASGSVLTFPSLSSGDAFACVIHNLSGSSTEASRQLQLVGPGVHDFGGRDIFLDRGDAALIVWRGSTYRVIHIPTDDFISGVSLETGNVLRITRYDGASQDVDLSGLAGAGASGTVFLAVTSNQTIASATSAGWNGKIVVARGFTSPVTLSFPGGALGPDSATTFLIENRGGATLNLIWGTSSAVPVKTGEGALMRWVSGPAWTITVFPDREGSGSGSFNLFTSANQQFSGAPAASDRFYMADVSDGNKIKYDTWNNHRNYILNSMPAVFATRDNGMHSDDRMFLTDASSSNRMEYTTLGRLADFLYNRYGIEVGGLTAVTTIADSVNFAVGVGTTARKITWGALKALLGTPSPSGNNLYFGALSVDPSNDFNPATVTALESDPIPASGTAQTITITRTWLNNRHFYLIQPAADDDQTGWTLGGHGISGWTKGTFRTGGTDWEYWKSETAWLSASVQTQPGSTNIIRITR